MPDGQRCAIPGCDEPITQPAGGGEPRLYCSHDHRVAARRLRSIARVEAGPAQDPAADDRSDSERRSGPRPAWIADPFSLPQNVQQHGDRMATTAAE